MLNIIELMEANFAEPLSLIEIADAVGLSRRQIERQQEMAARPRATTWRSGSTAPATC